MSASTKFLWNEANKRVERLEIPEQSGFAKAHYNHLRRERKRREKRARKH